LIQEWPVRVGSRLAEVAVVTAGVTQIADDFIALRKSAEVGHFRTLFWCGRWDSSYRVLRRKIVSGVQSIFVAALMRNRTSAPQRNLIEVDVLAQKPGEIC
jgi:hypothetical protein